MSDLTAKTPRRLVAKLLAAAATLLFLGTGMAPAFAAPGQVSLDVQQVISGPEDANDSFAFQLTADHQSQPLPAGGASGEYTFEIAGNATHTIGITFAEAGIYTYRLQCLTASSAQFTTDQQVYTITFYVEASLAVVTEVQLSDGAKAPQMRFTQTATQQTVGPPTIDDGPQTGDYSNPALWISLLAGSATLLVLLIVVAKRSATSGGDQ